MNPKKLPADTRILVVDDETDFRDALAFSFKRKGYQVICASNGNEAYELIQKGSIDVVISDIRMPGGDGIELLERTRSGNYAVPIVLLVTGYAEISTEDALEKGAEALFGKPFDRKVLEDTVQRLLTPPETRWAIPPDQVDSALKIELRFQNLSEAIGARVINLGRGGMFVMLPSTEFPAVGDLAAFEIAFGPDPSCGRLKGSGVVRWIRVQGTSLLPTGCGIEFTYLSEADIKRVQEFVHSTEPTPYVPNR
jgi:CheY-like chemotaxis protein